MGESNLLDQDQSLSELCIDSHEPRHLAEFWAADPEGNEFCVLRTRRP